MGSLEKKNSIETKGVLFCNILQFIYIKVIKSISCTLFTLALYFKSPRIESSLSKEKCFVMLFFKKNCTSLWGFSIVDSKF